MKRYAVFTGTERGEEDAYEASFEQFPQAMAHARKCEDRGEFVRIVKITRYIEYQT